MATLETIQSQAVADGSFLKTSELGGRERIAYAEAKAVQVIAQNDLLKLFKLPKNARITGGRVTFGAHGAGTTLSIGDATTAGKYLSALDVSAAGSANFADTDALNFGTILTAETQILASYLAANPTDNATLKVVVRYVLD